MSADDYHRWVRRFRDRVYTFAFYTLRQREDAEDVTQEVLIRLWRHRGKVEEERVLPWLLKVTRNACYDSLRRHKARRARVAPALDEQLLLEAPCERPSPLAEAEAGDFEVRLERALRQLSPSYREIVILREIDGLKYDEIAEVTGRPLSSVKVYLHRGRKQLRRALQDLGEVSAGERAGDAASRPSPTGRAARKARPASDATDSPLQREVAHA